ncbi:MAG: type I-G CRISPR-associated protein, Cas3-extension family, partial [Acidimicrobiales bacterium]
MTLIPLDALRSDDALGVLAALGTLELLTQAGGLEARLGWDGLGGAALLETDLSDGTSVALRLREVAERIRQAGGLVPASPSLVDRRRSQVEHRARKAEGIEERNDPMRGTREVARDRLLLVAELERDGDGATARWASGLLSMLGVDRAGDAALTPLYAPVGQQVLAQLLEKYLLLAC